MHYTLLLLLTLTATALPHGWIAALLLAFIVTKTQRGPLMLIGLTLMTIAAIGLGDTLDTRNSAYILAGFAAFAAGAVPMALRETLRLTYGLTLIGSLILTVLAFFTPIPASWLASLMAIALMGSILMSWRMLVEAYPLRAPFLAVPALCGVFMGYWGGALMFPLIALATLVLVSTPNRLSSLMALGAGALGTVLGFVMGAPSLASTSMDTLSLVGLVGGSLALAGLGAWRIGAHGWVGRMWGWTTLLFILPFAFIAQGPALIIIGLMAGAIVASIPFDMTPLSHDPILKAWRESKVPLTDDVNRARPIQPDAPSMTLARRPAPADMPPLQRTPLAPTQHRADPPLKRPETVGVS